MHVFDTLIVIKYLNAKMVVRVVFIQAFTVTILIKTFTNIY